jgi:hypothetical protein
MYSQKLRIIRLYLILTAVYGRDKTQELRLVTLFYYWLLPHQQCFSCFLRDTLLWKQTAKKKTPVTGTRHSRKRFIYMLQVQSQENYKQIYSKIPLIWHSQDRRGAGLSNSTLVLIGDYFVTALRECALATYFHLLKERYSFVNYHTPSHGASFGTQCWKPHIQHLVQLNQFRLFNMSFEKVLHTFT